MSTLILDLVIHWYLRKWKLKELESYFSNNAEVQAEKRFWWWNTFMNESFRLSAIVKYIVKPKKMIKRGEVTEEELAAIPVSLKRRLIAYHYFSVLQGTCLFAWYVWAKIL
jgi:hypothetical protein